jgi:hypothetical protein
MAKTLQGLIDAELARRAAVQAAADEWRRGKTLRENCAVDDFYLWLSAVEGADIDADGYACASELYEPEVGAEHRIYDITISLPALNACIEIKMAWYDGQVHRADKARWIARTLDNWNAFDTLTDALMWITDNGKIRLDSGIPVELPQMQEA